MKYYATMLNEKGVVAVDDTILVKDAPSTAGSRMLEGFKPLFIVKAFIPAIKMKTHFICSFENFAKPSVSAGKYTLKHACVRFVPAESNLL